MASGASGAFVFSTAGAWTQTHRLTRAIEIGNDADQFTDTVAPEIFETKNSLIAPIHQRIPLRGHTGSANFNVGATVERQEWGDLVGVVPQRLAELLRVVDSS